MDRRNSTGAQAHVDRLFLLAEDLGVGDDRVGALQEAVIVQQFPDGRDRLHRLVGGGRGIVGHRKERRVPAHENVQEFLRKQLLRDRNVREAVVPDHVFNVVDRLHLLLQADDLLVLFALHDQHGDRPGPEFIDQDILPLHGLDRIRQIHQHVVIDPRPPDPDDGGDQEQDGRDQDHEAGRHDRFSEMFHGNTCFSSDIDENIPQREGGCGRRIPAAAVFPLHGKQYSPASGPF